MVEEKNIERKIEKQEKSSVKLTLTVPADETTASYDALMAKYGKQAQIKGFRQGKVPRSVLERKFGEGIRQEAAADLIDESLKAVLEKIDEKPLAYGYPVLEGEPVLVPGETFTFAVTYDIFPEIKMGDYKGIPVEEPQVKILKKHETEELEKIRERNSVVVDKTDGIVEKGAVVTMDYAEIDENGDKVDGSDREGFVFTVGDGSHPYAVDEEVTGMKNGDKKTIAKSFPEEYEANAFLAGRDVQLEISITAVKERQLPELDDELAQDVSEDLKTLDDLTKKVKADLKERAENQIRNIKVRKLMEALETGADIDLPESMVSADLESTWQDYVRRSGVPEETLVQALEADGRGKDSITEQWRPDAEKSIKTRLVLGKIAETEKIETNDEEVETELKARADNFKMSVEELEKTFGGPQFRDYLKTEIAQRKLNDFLLDSAEIKKGEKIDYNDLMGM